MKIIILIVGAVHFHVDAVDWRYSLGAAILNKNYRGMYDVGCWSAKVSNLLL